MTTTFVTRHQGAIDWAREEGLLPADCVVASDYDPETTAPGDLVIGTLPAQIAARICERGARYQHLTLALTPELRGRELQPAEMRACNAHLEEFFIQRASVRVLESARLTHICIVSDQSLQNLLPAMAESLKADRCVLLTSVAMKQRGADRRLRDALQQAGCRDVEIAENIPDHDLASIIAWGNQFMASQVAQYPDHRFILNLTGGNKLMSAGLLQALRPWCEAVYCDTAHDRIEFLHPPGRPAVALPADLLSVNIYLAAQGYRMRESPQQDDFIEGRRNTTEWLAEHAHELLDFIGKLNRAASFHERNRDPSRNPHEGSAGSPVMERCYLTQEQSALERLLAAGLLERSGRDVQVPEAHADYLRGGWLEEYCFLVGKDLAAEGLLARDRFAINVKIDSPEQPASGHPLNELDAVFVHRNRMLIIECKTGRQIGDAGKSQTILNKLEVLGEHAAGKFAEKILLTTEARMERKAIERAHRYRIEIVSARRLPQLRGMVRRWMNT